MTDAQRRLQEKLKELDEPVRINLVKRTNDGIFDEISRESLARRMRIKKRGELLFCND